MIVLVITGVDFTWLQFKHDIDTKKNGPSAGAEKEHSTELSTSGIIVSSPALGVIILTLLLAFFYLCQVYVYPITEIF